MSWSYSLWNDCDVDVWAEEQYRKDWFLDLHVDSLLYHWLMHIIIAVYFIHLDVSLTLGLMYVCMWKLIRHLLYLWLYDCLWQLISPSHPSIHKALYMSVFFALVPTKWQPDNSQVGSKHSGHYVATILASNPGFLFPHTSHNSHVAWKWNGGWPAFWSVCMLVCVWHRLYPVLYNLHVTKATHKCDSSSCCVYNHRNLSCKSDIPYPNNYYTINIICNMRDYEPHCRMLPR